MMFEDISIDIDARPFDQEYNMPPQYSFNGKTKYDWCDFDFSRNAAPKKCDKDERVSLGQHTHPSVGCVFAQHTVDAVKQFPITMDGTLHVD